MSRRDLGRSRATAIAIACLLSFSFGCWEQIDDGYWFPQMKRQRPFQAFELVTYNDQEQGFTPPEGTVPIGWQDVPDLAAMTLPEQDQVQNPVPADYESLARGAELFERYCATCHGAGGGGDGPVAGAPFGTGPLGLVLPIGGATSIVKALTDGHIYATISLGRGRMPAYERITPEDRWNVVNYVRDLNGQGGRP